MVTNTELESQFKAFSKDYEGTKKTWIEKVNSIETRLEELSAMKGTLDKLSAAVLGKILVETTNCQDPQSLK